MMLTGKNFIGFQNSAEGSKTFQAFASGANQFLQGDFSIATPGELESVLSMANAAFPVYRNIPASERANFLDAIAAEILALGDELIERCSQESSLPAARITGERARTCGQ